MTDYEVSQRLGYDPCVCGKIDGTWHHECYRGKTKGQLEAGHRRAFAAARRFLKAKTSQSALAPHRQKHVGDLGEKP